MRCGWPCRQPDADAIGIPACAGLYRLIGLGLKAVEVARNRIEVLTAPGPYRPRPDQRRRSRLLSEHERTAGDPSPGGSSRQPIMTAYRQQALVCAALLQAGPGRPRDLRAVAPEAGRILLRNVYGWFERTARGVYRLNSWGEAALQRWPQTMRQAERGEPSRSKDNVGGNAAGSTGTACLNRETLPAV
jgi:hypothetical protein